MSEPYENSGTVRQWIEKAEHDIRNAEYTLTLKKIVLLTLFVFMLSNVPRNTLSPPCLEINRLSKNTRFESSDAAGSKRSQIGT